MYKVYDSLGNFMRRFPTYKQASEYVTSCGNPRGWRIVFISFPSMGGWSVKTNKYINE